MFSSCKELLFIFLVFFFILFFCALMFCFVFIVLCFLFGRLFVVFFRVRRKEFWDTGGKLKLRISRADMWEKRRVMGAHAFSCFYFISSFIYFRLYLFTSPFWIRVLCPMNVSNQLS